MIARLILWLSVIWLPTFMGFILKNETKFKKNIAVGVTFPYEGRTDEAVLARLKRFRKEVNWVCILLVLLAIPCMFIPNFSISITLWCVWLLVAIIAPYVPYVLCNRDLKIIKQQKGWRRSNPDQVTVNTAQIPSVRWLSPVVFLLPLVVSLLPFLWEREFWVLYLIDALCILLFWGCYRYLYRNKSEQVDDNWQLTQVLTQVRRHFWGLVWMLSSDALALLNVAVSLFHDRPIPMLIVILVISAALVGAAFWAEIKLRTLQETLTKDSGHGDYIDDDDKWIWGLFYYNPHDSHNLVNNRVGTNMTFNMAKPLGKICIALTALMLLSLPFLFPITEAILDKPPVLEISATELTASSGGTQYEIPLETIADVQLLEELPEHLIRTNGTGLEHLLKGQFTAKDLGSMRLCLDPTCPPFLLVTTEADQVYLVGTRDPEETQSTYEELLTLQDTVETGAHSA